MFRTDRAGPRIALLIVAVAAVLASACSQAAPSAPAAATTAPPAAKPTTAPPAVPTSAAKPAVPAASAAPSAAAAPKPAASPASAPAAADQTPDPAVNLRVAFVEFQTPQNDSWTQANVEGQQYMQKLLPNVQIKVVENVDDSSPKAATVLRQLAQEGNQVIFANGFGYQQFTPDIAKEFPTVIFIQQQADLTGPNLGSYWARLEEARYVQGVLAGKMTKSNRVGFTGGFPIPPVMAGVNAFYLGLKAANPAATMQVIWPNSWYDPPKEKEIADTLMNGGADIIAYHGDDATTLQAAGARGKWGMTSHADLSAAAPEAFLTGSAWNWGLYYTRTLKAIFNKTWKPEAYLGSMKDGTVTLAPYGRAVTDEAKKAAEQAKADIISGNIKVFQGPIMDQSGKVMVAAGATATDAQINSTDWLVQGIEGSPK